ncbi:MAG: hypothetical protein V3R82_06560 [Candidatus Hydrothermarchaeales archaeon]
MDRLSEENIRIIELDEFHFTISQDLSPERKPRRPKRILPNT